MNCKAVESDNNVFGRTLNPWNTMLTAGGSSGGEGALVAFRGTPLGVGTDLAGKKSNQPQILQPRWLTKSRFYTDSLPVLRGVRLKGYGRQASLRKADNAFQRWNLAG